LPVDFVVAPRTMSPEFDMCELQSQGSRVRGLGLRFAVSRRPLGAGQELAEPKA
jgi:hypothetical protein